jgi:hypothetical protein
MTSGADIGLAHIVVLCLGVVSSKVLFVHFLR